MIFADICRRRRRPADRARISGEGGAIRAGGCLPKTPKTPKTPKIPKISHTQKWF